MRYKNSPDRGWVRALYIQFYVETVRNLLLNCACRCREKIRAKIYSREVCEITNRILFRELLRG